MRNVQTNTTKTMKKILFSLLASSVTVAVFAQSNQAPAANAVMVSQTRNGDVVITRYKIPHNDGRHAGFDIYYAIDRSNIVPSFSENSEQMAELKEFMDQSKDSTMHISAIHIVGYASPDGNAKNNDSLASQRAQSLYLYAVNTYHPEQKIDANHKTFHWNDCVAVVEKSDVPHKDQVLAILQSTAHSEAQKEYALRKLPDVWGYLQTNILPQMRYADIEFDYGVDEFVTRTTVVKPAETAKPVQTAQPQQPNEVVVDEEIGVIIATPAQESRSEKRDERKSRKADKRSTKGEYEVIYW